MSLPTFDSNDNEQSSNVYSFPSAMNPAANALLRSNSPDSSAYSRPAPPLHLYPFEHGFPSWSDTKMLSKHSSDYMHSQASSSNLYSANNSAYMLLQNKFSAMAQEQEKLKAENAMLR